MISCYPAKPCHAPAVDKLARQAGLSVDLEQSLRSSHVHAWLAMRRERSSILGFAVAQRLADEFELVDIATVPHERQQGVASALLTRLLQVGDELGLVAMHLEVRSRNLAALRLYEKFGFELARTRRSYYRDPEDDALCLRRALAPGRDHPGK